jgi:hypothetical protein
MADTVRYSNPSLGAFMLPPVPRPKPEEIDLNRMAASIGLDIETLIFCLNEHGETNEPRWQHDRKVAAGFYTYHMSYSDERDMLRNIYALRGETGTKFDMGILSIAVRFIADRHYRIQVPAPVA